MRCGYPGDREEMLIAYLYDDMAPPARAEFQAHLVLCEPCRSELDALGGVRRTLAHWNPPEPQSLAGQASNQPSTINHQPSRWWQDVPAWAQVAAALLFLGLSAGIANLDVRHDSNGWTIRTGWMSAPARASVAVPVTPKGPEQIGVASQPADVAFTPASTADLTALERRLRDELRPPAATSAALSTTSATPVQTAPGRVSSDAEILRKVRTLIEDTERRQQRELALRLAQTITDVNAQRQVDLRKIDSRIDTGLNGVQNSLGVEVMKQRRTLNYIMQVNSKQ
jgi:hypothetical protein